MHNLQTLAHSDGVSTHRGFPNPALDTRGPHQTLALDFNQLLIRQASSTYVLQIHDHSHVDYGIVQGDLVVIDRALQAGASDLIVTGQGNNARMLRQHQLTPDDTPWGVVTAIIHQYR